MSYRPSWLERVFDFGYGVGLCIGWVLYDVVWLLTWPLHRGDRE